LKQETRVDRPILTFMVADANAAFREGVRVELEARSFALVGEATNVASAVALAVAEQPDLCIVDLDLPGTGLAAVSRIAKAVPTTCVIVLAEAAEPANVLAALERGAAGYMLNSVSGDELAASLRAACNGEPALSRSLVPLLVNQVRRGSRRRLVLPSGPILLTAREWDVGELLRDGFGTEEIATRLGVSPITVRRHVGLLLKKLGAPNRVAAVEALRMFAR
jgi:two-component system, NarL family, nitrate/nitrite response regulator NarL